MESETTMSDVFGEMPVVYGIYTPTGKLRHVDSVENGRACNCTCPDPRCGQRLIAKNAGKKVIHHFAHERGSCSWAVEYLISLLAAEAIRSRGCVTFPTLSYYDAFEGADVVHADSLTIPVASVELANTSGRQAPDVMLTWRSKSGEERTFAIVFQLVHRVTEEQVARLADVTEGVVLADLRADMRRALREQDRHADRNAIILSYQDANYLWDVLSNPRSRILRWAYNATADRLHAQSVRRMEAAEEARRKQAERLRKEREEREKRERAEREAHEAKLEEERRRSERRMREKERRLEEARKREEAMRPEHDHKFLPQMSVLVEQQDRPATDRFGRRWVKCKVCGKVAPEREFSVYGGQGSLNLGICFACMRGQG